MKRFILFSILFSLICIPALASEKTVIKKYDKHGMYQGKLVTEVNTTKKFKKNGNYESKYVQNGNKITKYKKNGNKEYTYKIDD